VPDAVENLVREREEQLMATIDDFEKIDMRVGRIIEVEAFPEARKPSLKLTIDFGELGIRRSSAGLKNQYAPEELVGRQVVCVVNFPTRRIAGFSSEVLVLGATQADGRIILLQPDEQSELGSPIA
jgi:tRNA-binding protein